MKTCRITWKNNLFLRFQINLDKSVSNTICRGYNSVFNQVKKIILYDL